MEKQTPLTAGSLKEFLANVPDEAEVSVLAFGASVEVTGGFVSTTVAPGIGYQKAVYLFGQPCESRKKDEHRTGHPTLRDEYSLFEQENDDRLFRDLRGFF